MCASELLFSKLNQPSANTARYITYIHILLIKP